MSHYDDEDQAEQLKAWWKENWKALAAGLVLGLGGIVGWEQYKAHKAAHSADAARLFDDFKAALVADNTDEVKSMGDKLKSSFADTPYAAQAMLKLAQRAVEKEHADEALPPLAWVAENSYDKALKPLAQLRAARVLVQQGKLDDALAKLNTEVSSSYPALVEELRGDIKLAQGDRKSARSAYEKALAATEAAAAARDGLQRKIDDLADAA